MSGNSSRRTFLKQATCAAAFALLAPSLSLRAVSAAIRPARMAVIIDDVGYNRRHAEAFLGLGVPLTFSILPQVPFTALLARHIHQAGHEIMLHQPMEPQNSDIDPGPGALYVKHTRADMEAIVDKNLGNIPFACGINNHMGSLFTESQTLVPDMLDIFKERSFFFIDSITSSNSIAFRTSREMDMVSACRNIFIDNVLKPDYIDRQLQAAYHRALRTGSAIAIGHPRTETVQALNRFLKKTRHTGIEFVYASAVAHERTASAANI